MSPIGAGPGVRPGEHQHPDRWCSDDGGDHGDAAQFRTRCAGELIGGMVPAITVIAILTVVALVTSVGVILAGRRRTVAVAA